MIVALSEGGKPVSEEGRKKKDGSDAAAADTQ